MSEKDPVKIWLERQSTAQLIQLVEAQCDPSGAFGTMLRKIKLTHKPKRNFMKYLAEAGL